MRFWFQTFFLLWFFISTGWALDVNEVVQRALDRDEQLRQERLGEVYDFTVVTKHLNREGNVRETQKIQAAVSSEENITYETLPDPRDEKRIHESRKVMAVMNLRKLAPRFELSLAPEEETVRGIPCYVVVFEPRPDQPYDSREEKVVNALTGKFWVSKEDFSIVKSEGELTKPVSVAWIFATMREVRFCYETAGESARPARFELLYDIQTTMTYRRREQISRMENYRSTGSEPRPALAQTGDF